MPSEYRVKWRREGQPGRRKIYQTRRGAEEFMRFALLDEEEATPQEETRFAREEYERMTAPFTEGPTLETRDVSEWRPVQERSAG